MQCMDIESCPILMSVNLSTSSRKQFLYYNRCLNLRIFFFIWFLISFTNWLLKNFPSNHLSKVRRDLQSSSEIANNKKTVVGIVSCDKWCIKVYNVSKLDHLFYFFSAYDDSWSIRVGFVLPFQGYGDNLKTFRDQVMKQPERLLFSNARLNKVIFQDSEKVWHLPLQVYYHHALFHARS